MTIWRPMGLLIVFALPFVRGDAQCILTTPVTQIQKVAKRGIVGYPENKLPREYKDIESAMTYQIASDFYDQKVARAIMWAYSHESIPYIKEKIHAIVVRKLQKQLTLVPCLSFYRVVKSKDDVRVFTNVLASPVRYSETQDQAMIPGIMIYVPAWEEERKLEDDKLKDCILAVVIHEFIHLEQQGFVITENLSREQSLEDEANAWWTQTKNMFIPMDEAKRYLSLSAGEAMATYRLLNGDRRAWKQWVEAKRFKQ